MSLIQHYRNLLPMARCLADEKGTIRALKPDGELQAHIVRAKQFVLPTEHYLQAENGEDLMFFHPFLEDGGKRVTEAVENYRSRVSITIGLGVISLMQKLSVIASSEEHSPPLKTQQIKMMQRLKELDAPAYKQINVVLTNILADPEFRNTHWPVKLFMGARGESPREKDSANYNYWTTVSFPLYEEIEAEMKTEAPKGGRKFAGTTVSNKTLRCLKALMEYIFSHVAEDNWYTSGSDSDVAPFMVSLLKAMTELTVEINEAIAFFDNQPGFEDIKLPTDWMDSVSAINSLYKEIVALPIRGQLARARTEENGNSDRIAPKTTAAPARQVSKPQEQAAPSNQEVPEFIRTERGLVRNPAFVQRAALGVFGSLTRRNPFDPLVGGLIVPDNATYAPQTDRSSAYAAWGNRDSGWRR